MARETTEAVEVNEAANETLEEEEELLEEEEEEVKVKGPSGISLALNKFFHHLDRGTTMKSEIGAGLGAFCIAVCALMMNTQIIGSAYGNYAGSYLAVALICFIGSLLLGILCNLPLVMTANMGLSAVLISMLGTDTGLTYANLMAVTFVAAIIYLVIVVTPLKNIFVNALPEGVRKALPVGIGIYVMLTALENSGILTADGALATTSDFTTLQTYYFELMIGATFLFILLKATGRKKPAFATFGLLIAAMWVGGVLFYMNYFVGGQTASTIVYERLNVVVATDGANPYNLATGIASLNIGALFTEGFDFSAYTEAGGSVPMFFLQGMLTFLFLGLYTNLGNTKAAAVVGGYEDEDYAAKGEQKALVVSAALNVAAPVLGASPTAVGTQSSVDTEDGGKTGLSSVAASLGFLVALFAWIFTLLFATKTNGAGMWVSETETKLAYYVQDAYVFADLIMVLVGASMLKGIRKVDTAKLAEMIPFAAAVVGIGLLNNIAVGVALGAISYVIVMAVSKERKNLTIANLVLAVCMLVYLILALI